MLLASTLSYTNSPVPFFSSASWLLVCSWTLVLYTPALCLLSLLCCLTWCVYSAHIKPVLFLLYVQVRSHSSTVSTTVRGMELWAVQRNTTRWATDQISFSLSTVAVHVAQLFCLQFPLVHTTGQWEGHMLTSPCTLTGPTVIHRVACRAIITTLWKFHRLNSLVWLTLNSIWQARLRSILWQILD